MEVEAMKDYTETITQADIDAMSEAVICNCAAGINGIAMQADLYREIDGADATIRVYFEIREGEAQDNEAIYTPERILYATRVD